MKQSGMREAMSAAPPISVTGLTIMGFPLSEWVLLGTALYTVLLIIDKLPPALVRIRDAYNWIKERHNGKDRSNGTGPGPTA